MDWIKYAASAVIGVIASYFKGHGILFVLVAVAVLFDFVTGMLAAVIAEDGLSSDKARKGLLKKIVLLIALCFGTFLDVMIPWAAKYVGIEMPASMLFSAMICAYICVTESISITENIFRCTNGAMPSWIVKMLQQAKETLEEGDQSE